VKVSLSNHFAPPLLARSRVDTQINAEELSSSHRARYSGIFTTRLCVGCNLILLLSGLFYQQIDKQRRLRMLSIFLTHYSAQSVEGGAKDVQRATNVPLRLH
jgi:hypothetical protein